MENQNLPDIKENTLINVQIPLTDAIAANRFLAPVSFVVAIVFFFFTFCDFKCNGQKLGSVTGFNLVTGTELKDRDVFSSVETKGKEIPASIWAIIAFGTAIFGAGVYLIKEKREAVIGTILGVIGTVSMIFLHFVTQNALEKETKGQVDVDFQSPYWASLISLALGTLVSYLRIQNSYKVVVNFSTPHAAKNTQKEEISTQSVTYENGKNIQLAEGFDTIKWVKKNDKKIIIGLISLLTLFGIWYFILRNDPEIDGKNIANSYCDCYENKNKTLIKTHKDFLDKFESFMFSGRIAASQKLQDLKQSVAIKTQQCLDDAQRKFNDLSERYSYDLEKFKIFDNAFLKQQNFCNTSSNELNSLINAASNKIENYIGREEIEKARIDSLNAIEQQKIDLAKETIKSKYYGKWKLAFHAPVGKSWEKPSWGEEIMIIYPNGKYQINFGDMGDWSLNPDGTLIQNSGSSENIVSIEGNVLILTDKVGGRYKYFKI